MTNIKKTAIVVAGRKGQRRQTGEELMKILRQGNQIDLKDDDMYLGMVIHISGI